MNSSVFAWLAIIGLGAAVGWQIHQNGELQSEVSALSEQLEANRSATETAGANAASTGPTLASGVLPRRLDGLQAQVERLQTDVERVAAVGKQAAATMASGAGSSEDLTERPQFRDAVRNVVLDLTEDIVFRQKLGGQVGRMDLGKNAPFVKVADTLKLDATQEDKFRKDLVALKEDVMLMLTETRSDDVDMMAEIQKVETLGENDPKRAKIFMQLFTLKVPGGEQSYWDRIVKMQGTFRARTDKYLSNEQIEIFNAVKIDLLSVDVE